MSKDSWLKHGGNDQQEVWQWAKASSSWVHKVTDVSSCSRRQSSTSETVALAATWMTAFNLFYVKNKWVSKKFHSFSLFYASTANSNRQECSPRHDCVSVTWHMLSLLPRIPFFCSLLLRPQVSFEAQFYTRSTPKLLPPVLVTDLLLGRCRHHDQGKHLIEGLLTIAEGESTTIVEGGVQQAGLLLEQRLDLIYKSEAGERKRANWNDAGGGLKPSSPPPMTHLLQHGYTFSNEATLPNPSAKQLHHELGTKHQTYEPVGAASFKPPHHPFPGHNNPRGPQCDRFVVLT